VQPIGLTRQEIEYLQQLIAKLDLQSPDTPDDRRRQPRIDFNHPIWLNLPTEPGHPWIHVYSRNLSTGGLGFLTRHLFYADQHLIIAHELAEFSPMLVLCRVCFCRTIALGVMEVGLAFVSALADPEGRRQIPADWYRRLLTTDSLARQKTPELVGA
jgi:hypothetical protein